jgi:hypothetical protein
MKHRQTRFRIPLLGLGALLVSSWSFAANFPLELVSPRAANTAPSTDAGSPAIPAGHRIFSAHPGVPYIIRAVVIAGAYPYTFSLSNAPSGMTIDPDTGVITWPNPQANATPTITVRDAEGTTRSSPWTITVTTSGFRFVDSVRGDDANAGTLSSPWRTFARMKAAGGAADIVYFRAGTYTTVGMEVEDRASAEFQPNGNWQGVMLQANNPTRLIAYPGETVIYDGGFIANQRQGNILRIEANGRYPVYIEGFQMRNIWHMGIQFAAGTCDYPVFRNLAFTGPSVSVDGQNSAAIMTTVNLPDPTWYGAYQGLSQRNGGSGLVKQYSHKKNLWEDFDIANSNVGPDQKVHVPRFEIRNSKIVNNRNMEQAGFFGNMQYGSGGNGETSSGEVRFNLVDLRGTSPTAMALEFNQNADSGQMFAYRNTLLGRVQVRNADAGDGPFRFYQNVIVNSDSGVPAGSHIYHEDVVMPSRIIATDNLTGSPTAGIVDAAGNLLGSFLTQFLGTRGHLRGAPGPRPSPPANASVQ